MARKKASDELSRDMIINEANKQFLELHYNEVSMRSIANKLGCSHGAIYYHFNNKQDLFAAVIDKYFSQLNEILEQTLQYDRDEGTLKILLGYIQFGLQYQSQYQYMFNIQQNTIDPLLQKAPNDSYVKFNTTLQTLHSNQLNSHDIYSTFISLHGFVMTYIGRVKNFEAAYDDAYKHCQYLIRALVH